MLNTNPSPLGLEIWAQTSSRTHFKRQDGGQGRAGRLVHRDVAQRTSKMACVAHSLPIPCTHIIKDGSPILGACCWNSFHSVRSMYRLSHQPSGFLTKETVSIIGHLRSCPLQRARGCLSFRLNMLLVWSLWDRL